MTRYKVLREFKLDDVFIVDMQNIYRMADEIVWLREQLAASEPVAWALMYPSLYDGSQMIELYQTRKEAEDMGDERTSLVPLYTHPSAAAVTVTEAMVEAGAKALALSYRKLTQQSWEGASETWREEYRSDARVAITAALTAASEGSVVTLNDAQCVAIAKAVDNCIRNGFTEMRDIIPAIKRAASEGASDAG